MKRLSIIFNLSTRRGAPRGYPPVLTLGSLAKRPSRKSTQSGAVLGIALIILLVLSFIGIISLQDAAMEQRIIGNLQDMELSMQSTESTLREAENYIEGLTDTSGFGTSGGLYTLGNAPDAYSSGTWSGTASIVSGGNFGSVTQPRYFIELVGTVNPDTSISSNVYGYGQASANLVTIFRVDARGTGGTGTSEVILESYYGKQF